MRWRKHGLIYGPDARMPWADHSALTPTPILLGDVIRVFAGFRDREGISRIGFVDVSANDPSRVLEVSARPSLDIGRPGTFDDHGVILGDVIPVGHRWHMYYVGFQLVEGVKFLAFTGLATADSDARSFSRLQETPVLDRSDEGLFIRAIHTVRHEGDSWKAWYAAGRQWEWRSGQPYPAYDIRHLESRDGVTFAAAGSLCLAPQGDEYRIGRPRVSRSAGGYTMLFTKGTRAGGYDPGWASSPDGRNWRRDDSQAGITMSASGWDSQTLCYPTPLQAGARSYLFYNGNDMGRAGFGFAEGVDD